MIIFRCDICHAAFDGDKNKAPNKIAFLHEPTDLKYRDVKFAEWEELKLPAPLNIDVYKAEYHICPECFSCIRDLLNNISPSK